MTVKNKTTPAERGRGPTLLAAGGLLGALAASSCCILPLVLFSLGASGAWIGNFTRLAPYQPIFIAFTLVCLGTGAWLVRRASSRDCAEGAACARPLSNRIVKAAFVVAALLVLAALGLDLAAPLFLNS